MLVWLISVVVFEIGTGPAVLPHISLNIIGEYEPECCVLHPHFKTEWPGICRRI
jgi:hypothetical protein